MLGVIREIMEIVAMRRAVVLNLFYSPLSNVIAKPFQMMRTQMMRARLAHAVPAVYGSEGTRRIAVDNHEAVVIILSVARHELNLILTMRGRK